MTPLQDNQLEHAHMLSQQWPTAGIIVMAIAGIAVWFASHRATRRWRDTSYRSIALLCVRAIIGAIALWLVCNALNRGIVLATGWSIPAICFFVAMAIELILWFYHVERKFVAPALGKTLAGLRVALVLTLGAMLLQPVFAWAFERTHDRYIAILVDESQSMQIVDQQLTEDEQMRVTKLLGEKSTGYSREQLVREFLKGKESDSRTGVIEKLREQYKVRLFQFSSEASEVEVDPWLEETANQNKAGESETKESAKRGEQNSLTNIAEALNHVNKQIARENLAGVLLITDGQHNTPDETRSIAAQLGAGNVPVSAVVAGSSKRPIDAAIVDVQVPDTVQEGDLLAVNTRVRIDGMRGRKFRAVLINNDKKVAERTISVASDAYTTDVELLHKTSSDGIVSYRVELEPVGEAVDEQPGFDANNSEEFNVSVTDNRSEVLLIEGRPRWEFGYLRSLFAGRDPTIQLQSVMLEPDRLDANVKRPSVFATASRDAGDDEATLLPKDESEWMKFDVIIIGDVRPDAFSQEQSEILAKFVERRGGTLIVIAGQRNMPHRFDRTALAEMLPIEFEPQNSVQFQPPEKAFRFRATSIGKQHPIMLLADSESESDKVWNEIPDLYWRHAIRGIKPGGRVLAYASVPEKEKALQAVASESSEQAASRRKQLNEYQEKNALIAISQFGAGRVMMFNTDRTWRLRYRVGDVYHHRFWGQIMRWANADKLQGGNNFVRVGTQRTSYLPGESIVVNAKLTDEKFSPLDDANAKVKVFADDKLVLTRKLDPVADSPGMYRVDLGSIDEAGGYRIELDSTVAKETFEKSSDENKRTVATSFVVESTDDFSTEMTETVADRPGLQRLTAAAGGTLVEIDQADELLDDFADSSGRYIESHSVRLWDTWPLLVLMVLLITVEWILRKKGGLV